MTSLVTLTTDFGARDPYVAAMKGVLFRVCPGVQVLDLTHEIPPQDVMEGALFLAGIAPYFPPGTIHAAVIDPGVGTGRLAVAAAVDDQVFVVPDNGLLTLVLRNAKHHEAHIIENSACMLPVVSDTFHGRDIFAPAAAQLACGMDLDDVGPRLADLRSLDFNEAQTLGSGAVRGQVIHIDRFGNAITNICRPLVEGLRQGMVRCGQHEIRGILRTYSDVPPKHPVALFGSSGLLEIAINEGHAASALDIHRGDDVEVGS